MRSLGVDHDRCAEKDMGEKERVSPYVERKTLLSVVIYLDILGYTSAVEQAYSQHTENQLLARLYEALQEAKVHLSDEVPTLESPKEREWEVKLFTDNLVIGMPVFWDGEDELGSAFQLAGMYQYSLAQRGFFIRGAIAVGDLYMAGDMVFGNGLLRAYHAAESLARDPRIVLAPCALDLVKAHLCYHASVKSAPHEYHLLVDSDRQVFVNYLMVPLDSSRGNEDHRRGIQKHKCKVEENLVRFRPSPRIWNKYSWAGNYHNFACDWQYPGDPDVKITNGLLQSGPQKLHEAYEKRSGNLVDLDSGELTRFQDANVIASKIRLRPD
jgi:hypothetical protein